METVDMWQQPGFLAEVFGCFKRHGLSIDLISTSETNVTVTLDRTANVVDHVAIGALIRELSPICQIHTIDSCAFVSLVGKNIRAILHKLGPALEIFEEQKIYLVSQAANDLNLTFVVEEEQTQRLVERLHEQLFGKQSDNTFFGPTWLELNEKRIEGGLSTKRAWWLARKDELISLAGQKSPIYVYDEETIKILISKLKALKSIDRIFYAVKANANPRVLSTFYDAGLGFECVSINEVLHVLKLFSKIDVNRILFTPNFAPRAEYERAFKLGVTVTLDNLYPLEAWNDLFKKRDIFLRIDPGQGLGHHKFVRTAGAKSKFGILESQLDDVKKLLKKCRARVKGLHAHVGSNIFTPDTWGKTAIFLASVAARFPDVETIDVGGGLGVVERPGQMPLDLNAVEEGLLEAKTAYPQYKFWMEPGRYLVAEAGVLLTRVTQTKQKEEYQYVGVDAGMNTLIRPALYGSYHEIVSLSRIDEAASTAVNVVGPICESGDILGHERYIAESKDGDVLLIATVGAYGRVMSSTYNMRPLAEEYILLPIVKR
jgi:diaminopimelate decarboxylase/aspartate kinase